ncbi:TetR/AcrR family transcriptional regulator [Mycolicibacterium farcinogenes]|uniref:TetR/AcrR family transcriptional regulator n=1 Tax=Mycolicibacterium farcinogenes TaxID=1802 RepID=A0ACD1FQZ9_MYCFR|nr:TetR/AcrR family transcriptional regulator [Mycolicibacterium farcinogenes]QZH69386.1 TetR/AcrR family transcriptional regulator [Mycolicibacterium farcinogenes]
MTLRQETAARTRQSLVDAGLRIAEQSGLSGLSVNRVVDEAGVSKGTFFHHFGDRASYLVALHRGFHDRILADTISATETHRPGVDRLLLSASTYLNVCLRERGVRALLLEARAEPAIADEVRARNAANATLCEPDFQAMSWPHPHQSAQLWVGMVAEAALIEFDTGRKLTRLRTALAGFLGSEADHS